MPSLLIKRARLILALSELPSVCGCGILLGCDVFRVNLKRGCDFRRGRREGSLNRTKVKHVSCDRTGVYKGNGIDRVKRRITSLTL